MSGLIKGGVGILIALALAAAHADETYHVNGKEVTKGEAIVAAAKDPSVKIQRVTDMKINMDKGTLVKK